MRNLAQFGFDPRAGRVRQRYCRPRELDVVLEGQLWPVDHQGAVAGLHALLDLGQVEVDADCRGGVARDLQGNADQRRPTGMVEVAGSGEDDHRPAGLRRPPAPFW
jgi:hypothetical protein